MRRSLAAATALLAALEAPEATAETAFPVGRGWVFAPYGQLHFAYQTFDDGQRSTDAVVDPSTSPGQVGFRLRGPGALSAQFETSLGFRHPGAVSQLSQGDFWEWRKEELRRFQLDYTGLWGTFSVGQGSMPSDGAAQSDLAGTSIIAKATVAEGDGGWLFRRARGTLSAVNIGAAFDDHDGDRLLRLRWDTPDLAGVSLGAAVGTDILRDGRDGARVELIARWRGALSGLEAAAAGGFGIGVDKGESEVLALASVSVLHTETGLNLVVGAGREENGRGGYLYVKPGWNADIVSFGTTKFAGELFFGTDQVARGDDSFMWGLAVIQEIEAARLEVYAGWRAFTYSDRSPVSYLDAGAFQVGTRWRF